MSKKITETKTEKRTEKKQPTELKDEQLDKAQGGFYLDTFSSFRTLAPLQKK